MASDDASREDRYTDPDLRARLKDEIEAGDRGGRKGQWSARKAQLLVQEYEKAGGGYTTDERDDAAQHLQQWTAQEWRTADGETGARGPSGTSRYLPDVAWKLLSPAERKQTEQDKDSGDGQFVANTAAAREARQAAELLTLTAADAVKAVRSMEGDSVLRRAERAEQQHGKARKTVLRAIDRALG